MAFSFLLVLASFARFYYCFLLLVLGVLGFLHLSVVLESVGRVSASLGVGVHSLFAFMALD